MAALVLFLKELMENFEKSKIIINNQQGKNHTILKDIIVYEDLRNGGNQIFVPFPSF